MIGSTARNECLRCSCFRSGISMRLFCIGLGFGSICVCSCVVKLWVLLGIVVGLKCVCVIVKC